MTIKSVPDNSELIVLKVLGQDNSLVHFKIRKKSSLIKLFDTYCKMTGLVMDAIIFRYDGLRLIGTDTPASLEMENDDTIDVY